MALPAFASLDDFRDRLPDGIADGEENAAQAVLDDVSTAIRNLADRDWVNEADEDADLAYGVRVDFGTLPRRHQDEIVRITLAAAKRAFVNPAAVEEETAGPFTTRFANASPDVYLNAAERASVLRIVGKADGAVAGLSSIRVEAPLEAAGVRRRLLVDCEDELLL